MTVNQRRFFSLPIRVQMILTYWETLKIGVAAIKSASVVALSSVVSLMESTQFPVRLLMSIADGGFLLARVPMSYFQRDPILAPRTFSFLMKWLLLPQRRPVLFPFRFCAREHRDIDVRLPSKPTCTSRRDKYHEAAGASIKYFYIIHLPLISIRVTLSLSLSSFSYFSQKR